MENKLYDAIKTLLESTSVDKVIALSYSAYKSDEAAITLLISKGVNKRMALEHATDLLKEKGAVDNNQEEADQETASSLLSMREASSAGERKVSSSSSNDGGSGGAVALISSRKRFHVDGDEEDEDEDTVDASSSKVQKINEDTTPNSRSKYTGAKQNSLESNSNKVKSVDKKSTTNDLIERGQNQKLAADLIEAVIGKDALAEITVGINIFQKLYLIILYQDMQQK